MVFFFNRHCLFDNSSHQSAVQKAMRMGLAYMFSALPETVDIVIKSLNETMAEAAGPHGGAGADLEHPTRPGWPGNSPSSATGLWPSGNRRLAAEGEDEEMQVDLHFRDRLPYKVDRRRLTDMVDSMIKVGSFEPIEDAASHEKGPLYLTRFYIAEEDGEKHARGPSAPAVRVPSGVPAGKVKGLLAGALLGSPLRMAALVIFALVGVGLVTMCVLAHGSGDRWMQGRPCNSVQLDGDDSDWPNGGQTAGLE
jgi:hypothetical protein